MYKFGRTNTTFLLASLTIQTIRLVNKYGIPKISYYKNTNVNLSQPLSQAKPRISHSGLLNPGKVEVKAVCIKFQLLIVDSKLTDNKDRMYKDKFPKIRRYFEFSLLICQVEKCVNIKVKKILSKHFVKGWGRNRIRRWQIAEAFVLDLASLWLVWITFLHHFLSLFSQSKIALQNVQSLKWSIVRS